MRKWPVLFATAFFLAGMVASCGVSDGMLDDAENRINILKSKGLPDSILSKPQVHLYQARDAKRRGQWSDTKGEVRKAAKLLKKELVRAEAYYKEKVSKLRPTVDSLRAVLKRAGENFSGLTLKKFDSLNAIVDSFSTIDWLLQSRMRAQELIDLIPAFTADIERAKRLRDSLPGEWVCTQQEKSAENKEINAVTKKVFTFEKNGRAKFVESKKGQSGKFLKEDWEFVSTGTWVGAGDTVYLFVTRFAAVRQMFERLYILEGGKKREWRKEPKPTYDSTITDGSQDRFIAYSDLKEDFVRTRKFK